MKTYKKRVVKKSAKRTISKVPKSLKLYVKKAIHKANENKYHLVYGNNNSITSPYVQNLMPPISIGNQHSQRIGNNVTIMRCRLDFVVNNLPYNSITNPKPSPIFYRWFIMSQIKENSNTFDSGGFFELNNSSTIIQYNNLDQCLMVNPSKYKVHKSGRFTLGQTATSTQYPAANANFDNNKMAVHKTIYFNKYINKKLIYDDGGTTVANCNLWLIILPTQCNGDSNSGYTTGQITYAIHTFYEDS